MFVAAPPIAENPFEDIDPEIIPIPYVPAVDDIIPIPAYEWSFKNGDSLYAYNMCVYGVMWLGNLVIDFVTSLVNIALRGEVNIGVASAGFFAYPCYYCNCDFDYGEDCDYDYCDFVGEVSALPMRSAVFFTGTKKQTL